MKPIYTLLLLFISTSSLSQIVPPKALQEYYNTVDFSQTQLDLFNELATTTALKHSNSLSYSPGIWNACRATDEDSYNTNNVHLFYGYSDTDGNPITDKTRDKELNGGTARRDWNREHVFPNSLARPKLKSSGTSGPPYADAHNLRASDVMMNSKRSNRKYASGSGHAKNVSGNWYPGDVWKGDAARIIMFMYLRYGSQCHPSFAAVGTKNNIDPNMVDVLLQWNAEDPVSPIEQARNSYHGNTDNAFAQGNRNPFIDNPYLATAIWGGMPAENTWGSTIKTQKKTIKTTKETSVALKNDTSLNPKIKAKTTKNTTENTINQTANDTNCVSQNFEAIPKKNGSYTARTWTDHYGTWKATKARTDQILNTRAIVIDVRTNRNGAIIAPTINGGIGDLTVSTQQVFSGKPGVLSVCVNGELKGTVPYSKKKQTTTITNINIQGAVSIVIEDKDNNTGARVAIDDLSWSCYPTP